MGSIQPTEAALQFASRIEHQNFILDNDLVTPNGVLSYKINGVKLEFDASDCGQLTSVQLLKSGITEAQHRVVAAVTGCSVQEIGGTLRVAATGAAPDMEVRWSEQLRTDWAALGHLAVVYNLGGSSASQNPYGAWEHEARSIMRGVQTTAELAGGDSDLFALLSDPETTITAPAPFARHYVFGTMHNTDWSDDVTRFYDIMWRHHPDAYRLAPEPEFSDPDVAVEAAPNVAGNGFQARILRHTIALDPAEEQDMQQLVDSTIRDSEVPALMRYEDSDSAIDTVAGWASTAVKMGRIATLHFKKDKKEDHSTGVTSWGVAAAVWWQDTLEGWKLIADSTRSSAGYARAVLPVVEERLKEALLIAEGEEVPLELATNKGPLFSWELE